MLGFDLAIADLQGFDFRGEFVRNFQYRRFPNENVATNQTLATNEAQAMYRDCAEAQLSLYVFRRGFQHRRRLLHPRLHPQRRG